jgi:alginate O-acetyltransferase complex protein AlgI
MLFNSYSFLFAFLPVALAGYFLACHLARRWSGAADNTWGGAWLAACSVFFYAWWDVRYLPLLLGSVAFNYLVGRQLARQAGTAGGRRLLALGVAANLGLLGYYKYTDFFLASLNNAGLGIWELPGILLPIGISFFTFTQIAFLADAAAGKVTEYRFVHYLLFVTYFPHLVAGPVLHHREMMPQFEDGRNTRPDTANLSAGLAIFTLGLAKKVLVADTLAVHATPVFAAAGTAPPDFVTAWGGALAYTFQLYFDFSGYSDMAIGLSRMFGVRLPLNFDSPYKARNISEFWRRWHMTLSRFLRDYLYIPLGGNRHGEARRQFNLAATMVLGGLWHGAGWTFIIWGALHGCYLAVNHAWRDWRGSATPSRWRTLGATALTFLCVVIGWVFFRSPDVPTALNLLGGMAGMHGVAVPSPILAAFGSLGVQAQEWGVRANHGGQAFLELWASVGIAGGLAFLAPNTQQWIPDGLWQPTRRWMWATGLLLALCLLALGQPTEFLYFQF